MALFRLNSVSVTYPGPVHALRDVTLDIAPGEFVVLLGPSGAGKSTLLRTLNYLTAPTAGVVETTDLGSLADPRILRRHRQRTAMVFQLHQLIGRYSALRNVEVGRVGRKSTLKALLPLPKAERRFCLECLDRVGLLDKALARADQLSGGQRQRVGIARALAQQPEVILADEPVASLDPETSIDVLDRLRTVTDEDGLTTIVSLHQLDLARQFGHRIVGVSEGRVVFDGPASAMDEQDLTRIYGSGRAAATAISTEAPAGSPLPTSHLDELGS